MNDNHLFESIKKLNKGIINNISYIKENKKNQIINKKLNIIPTIFEFN